MACGFGGGGGFPVTPRMAFGPVGTTAWRNGLSAGALGTMAGGLVGLAVTGDDVLDVWALRQALVQLQEAHQVAEAELAVITPPSAPSVSVGVPQRPPVSVHDAAWLWLQSRLQAQGLAIQSVRPDTVQWGLWGPSQSAQLRWQGAWTDWLAFVQDAREHSPWWSLEQWTVQAAPVAGQVQMQAQWRIWLDPATSHGAQTAWRWPQWPAQPGSDGPALFSLADGAPQAQMEASVAPATARTNWDWWGVWSQSDGLHVVLGRGQDWSLVRPGERVGASPYRLLGADERGLRLQSTANKPSLFLSWGDAP